jgi:DNA (cytosine-5)-methyltransferase 1
MRRPTVVSLFTGAMGLDLGFEMEGFEIRVTLDVDEWACKTVSENRTGIPVIRNDIRRIPTDEILRKAGLGVGGPAIVTGGPPCQSFSTAGRRRSINDDRPVAGGDLVFEFLRIVQEAKPQFFVFENVTGLLSAAIRHISFYERARFKEDEMPVEAKLGTAFGRILDAFKGTGYSIKCAVLNSADYGVAQVRKRLFIVGSRNRTPLPFPPTPTHAPPGSLEVASGSRKPWLTLRDAIWNLKDREDLEYLPFPSWGKYLKYVPPGGCWVNLPKELQKDAMGGAYDDPDDPLRKGRRGGRRGFFRRLSWDRPAPTLVTSPLMKATCLCHPDHDRPLSVEEYARVQSFPTDWVFVGPTQKKYRMIGEAVPPPLASAVAMCILRALRENPADGHAAP